MKTIQEAKQIFAAIHERCKVPGNCRRCGHKNPDQKFKTCPRCRSKVNANTRKHKLKIAESLRSHDAMVELRQRIRNMEAVVNNLLALEAVYSGLTKRIGSLELGLARVDVSVQRDHNRTFQVAYRAGLRRREQREMPRITKQELATMNHAYDNEAAA